MTVGHIALFLFVDALGPIRYPDGEVDTCAKLM